MLVIGTALGLLIGLALGMLGGGGSILTVPAFVYVLGFEAKPAIAMSLAVVGVTALVGAVGHWRVGNVHLRVALVFGGVAMAGAYLGAKLSVFFSGSTQLTLFAAVMIAAAYFMLRGRVPGVSVEQTGIHLRRGDRIPIALIVLAGIAVGILTGLVGVGGGFLIVPALVLLVRVSMKQAVGTSLAVISMNATAGFLGYVGEVQIAWVVMAAFAAVAMVGITVGTRLVRFIRQQTLRRAFAVLLLIVGAMILYQNRNVLIPEAEASVHVVEALLR